MQRELELPPEKSREFLDYLNCELRKCFTGVFGEVRQADNGEFLTSKSGTFSFQGQSFQLKWSLAFEPSGKLLRLEVRNSEPDNDDESWDRAVQTVLTRVLTEAFAERKAMFFQRRIFHYCGPQLDGEYWLSGFRISPVDVDHPAPGSPFAEHVLAIDMEIPAIDILHAGALSVAYAARVAALLSFLLDVGLRNPRPIQRWVLPDADPIAGQESVCRLATYIRPGMYPTRMPRKGELCAPGQHCELRTTARPPGKMLLPRESRRLFRLLDESPPRLRESFEAMTRLWQSAVVLGDHLPSASLAYRVAAVDGATQSLSPSSKFVDFVERFAPTRPDVVPLARYLWREIRCAHFHGGAFPLGEFDQAWSGDSIADPWYVERMSVHDRCAELLRETLVNWTVSQLGAAETSKDDA